MYIAARRVNSIGHSFAQNVVCYAWGHGPTTQCLLDDTLDPDIFATLAFACAASYLVVKVIVFWVSHGLCGECVRGLRILFTLLTRPVNRMFTLVS